MDIKTKYELNQDVTVIVPDFSYKSCEHCGSELPNDNCLLEVGTIRGIQIYLKSWYSKVIPHIQYLVELRRREGTYKEEVVFSNRKEAEEQLQKINSGEIEYENEVRY